MKSISKKIILILAILMLLFSINSKVFAWSEIISDGKSFISQADSSKANIDTQELKQLSGYLYNILLAVGIVVAVIVATVLGVQFIIGGAEGQAKVKEMLIPFVVGCIIVFGGFGIWKVALTVGERIESTDASTSTYNLGADAAKQWASGKSVSEAYQEYQRVISQHSSETGLDQYWAGYTNYLYTHYNFRNLYE